MKKIFLILIVLLSLKVPTIKANNNIYVTDNANLLSNDTISFIETYSAYLKEELNIDYRLVTIKNTENLSLELYTNNLFSSYKQNDNILLIVISSKDREIRIKTGSTISKIISNTTIDSYLKEYFLPFLQTNEWDEGIKNGYSAFFKLICNYHEIDSSIIKVYNENNPLNKYKIYFLFFIIWLNSLISYIYIKYFKNKLKKELNIIDTLILILTIFLNIFLLIISYYLKPIYLLIVLVCELSFITTSIPKKIKNNIK